MPDRHDHMLADILLNPEIAFRGTYIWDSALQLLTHPLSFDFVGLLTMASAVRLEDERADEFLIPWASSRSIIRLQLWGTTS